ncbi:MAG: Acetoin utilization protein AcuC [Flavobacteriaceae bacterium]|jgi:acetoin utilization deacetylase AcuC-like enzyme|nr:MAG: Acetoin utilization protein AcuC [Flavobacteriaceae bacterium]
MLKIAFDSIYVLDLPEGHRFPMLKYDLLPKQLIHEGTCSEENFFSPEFLDPSDALSVHTESYFRRLLNSDLTPKEVRKIGFPLSQHLIDREQRIAQGTIQNCYHAFNHGISINIAGGTHHAYADHGEAFCLLNDQAIAASHLIRKGLIRKALIIDLDVHQGNGTASIFQKDSSVFTFSVHGAANYPFKKEESDLDLPLPKGCSDLDYLALLDEYLDPLIEEVQPDFIFYLSGVDILETDRLGTLGLTLNGCKERDHKVLNLAHSKSIPIQCSMGGGYSKDIRVIVEAHANLFRIAQYLYD